MDCDVVGDSEQLRVGEVVGEGFAFAGGPGPGAGDPRVFTVTMWSMSTSEAAVQVAPSSGLYQVPEVAAHEALTTTLVPSRLRTVSRVSQVPEMVFLRLVKRSDGLDVVVRARTVAGAHGA